MLIMPREQEDVWAVREEDGLRENELEGGEADR
jgi:hypothetical protein